MMWDIKIITRPSISWGWSLHCKKGKRKKEKICTVKKINDQCFPNISEKKNNIANIFAYLKSMKRDRSVV